MQLPRLVEQAHELIRPHLKPGDFAIDATIGNGYDTLFLAQCVGPQGTVLGFDTQAAALETTRQRLVKHGISVHIELVQESHIYMPHFAKKPAQAIVFNLGYLPGQNKGHTTEATSTLQALDAAIATLAPGGILTCLVYPGHPAGQIEAIAVAKWMATMGPRASCHTVHSPTPTTPTLWYFVKKLDNILI